MEQTTRCVVRKRSLIPSVCHSAKAKFPLWMTSLIPHIYSDVWQRHPKYWTAWRKDTVSKSPLSVETLYSKHSPVCGKTCYGNHSPVCSKFHMVNSLVCGKTYYGKHSPVCCKFLYG